MIKTLTYDRSEEFSGHEEIDKAFGSAVLYLTLCQSERDPSKNLNGLLWQYISMKRRFTNITDEDIKIIKTDWVIVSVND